MKHIIIESKNTGVSLERYPQLLPTEEQISTFEAQMGFRLPKDYRAFLLEYNGGTCVFGSVIESLDSVLCDLYCFDTDGTYGCMPLQLPQDCTEWEMLPHNCLLIGETDGGDAVALLFEADETAVVVIDHESAFSQEKILLRCPDFTTFLSDTVRTED